MKYILLGQAAAANPGGSQPAGAKVAVVQVPKEKSQNLNGIMVEDEFCPEVQPGIVQAAATQPGVRRGTFPGKSLLRKGL